MMCQKPLECFDNIMVITELPDQTLFISNFCLNVVPSVVCAGVCSIDWGWSMLECAVCATDWGWSVQLESDPLSAHHTITQYCRYTIRWGEEKLHLSLIKLVGMSISRNFRKYHLNNQMEQSVLLSWNRHITCPQILRLHCQIFLH